MIDKQLISKYKNFPILVKEILEGFITGLHKSPFHGFSSEFSEYKQYTKGNNIKDIDWRLYGKTDKLFIKKYQEETNIRCHFIIDSSSSMHYPKIKDYFDINNMNKFSFSVFATACIIEIMKKQQDAVGLSMYSNEFEFYITEKTSPKHHNLIFNQLEKSLLDNKNIKEKTTDTYKILHNIAERLNKKSLVILFTDMLDDNNKELFEALKHLKYGSHKVILFHTYDNDTELNFDIESKPSIFIDLETNEKIKIKKIDDIKGDFINKSNAIFSKLKLDCSKYKIDYISVNIKDGLYSVLEKYLIKRKSIK